MRLQRCIRQFVLLTGLCILMAACTGIEGAASMQVWLDYPYEEVAINEGSTFTFMATARDVNGPGIIGIQFFSNGQMIASADTSAADPLVSANYTWQPEVGTHEVFARAQSVSGGIAYSQPVIFTVIQMEDPKDQVPLTEASKTATLTPTATTVTRTTPSVTTTITTTPVTPTITKTPVTPTPTITPVTPTVTPSRTLTATRRPPEVYLYADRTNLSPGECTTLTWETVNISEVTLNGVPLSSLNGSTQVCPVTSQTTYTLMGYSSGGIVSDSVTIRVNYNFPQQQFSIYAGISITGGHGSIHKLGDTVQICYNFSSQNYIFEFRDYSPASLGSDGATGPYSVLSQGSMYDSQNVCKNYTLVAPAGYEAFQFRVKLASEGNPVLIDVAELWIYVYP